MKKNIWIMNHYAGRMYFDMGGRHYSFAKYLKKEGYEPVIFCANSVHGKAECYYNTKSLWQEYFAEEIGVPFVYVKARTYTGNGKQRILNMIDFYRNVKRATKKYAACHEKPDIIYASSVHPLTLVAGIQLAKYFGVECICEIRDLWPETLVNYGALKRNSFIAKILYAGEKWIYKKADRLIFTMEGGNNYIHEQGWEKAVPDSKVFHLNNGVDLDTFRHNQKHFQIEDPDLENSEIIKVVYTGSIRRINNLGLILDAAKKLTNPQIKLLMWGDGDELPTLQQRVEKEQIKNISFKGHVKKEYIPSIISRADLNLIHWEASDLLRFGVSYNKLFEYLAAARPIFSTVHPGYSIVERSHCGIDMEDFTPETLAMNLQQLSSRPQSELLQMGKNASAAAEKYDFQHLTKELILIMERGNGL